MSKREKIQEYVLIPKWKLIALEKKGHFDPDLDTSVLDPNKCGQNFVFW